MLAIETSRSFELGFPCFANVALLKAFLSAFRELALSVLPPKNQGVVIQLTLLKGTDVLTVIAVPAVAAAGSGDTVTETPLTDTPVA